MHTWGKTFKRIPDEWRKAYLEHERPAHKIREDLVKAFDQIYVQKWVIRFLVAAVSVEFGAVKWLASRLWDCTQLAHQATALIR